VIKLIGAAVQAGKNARENPGDETAKKRSQNSAIYFASSHSGLEEWREQMISEKRNVIMAPFTRTMNEIFSERDLKRLASFANVL
jgi:hypothetical protein